MRYGYRRITALLQCAGWPVAYEAAGCGLLSPDLAAGIRRVKGVKRLGIRIGNWLTADEGKSLLTAARLCLTRGSHRLWPEGGRDDDTAVLRLSAPRRPLGDRRPHREGRAHTHSSRTRLG